MVTPMFLMDRSGFLPVVGGPRCASAAVAGEDGYGDDGRQGLAGRDGG